MEELLKDYFYWVFTEDFFTVALDVTGCYLFSDDEDDSVIQQQLEQFRDTLGLTKKQVSVCVLNRKSKFNYCSGELIAQYVLQAVQHRKAVLSKADIQSILDCFGVDSSTTTAVKKDWSNTELYKGLLAWRDAKKADLSDQQLNDVCKFKPVYVTGTRNLEIPDCYAWDIISMVKRAEHEEPVVTEETLSSVSEAGNLVKESPRAVILCLALLILTVAVLAFRKYLFVAVIPLAGAVSSLFMIRTRRWDFSKRVLTTFTSVIAVITAIMLLEQYGPKVITKVSSIWNSLPFVFK